jgi:hypothetical protein
MKKPTNPFENVTAAATSRRKATRYVTPNGKERHVDEKYRNAFDYLITEWNGTDSSASMMNMVQVEDSQINLAYLSGLLFYCTDEMPPDVIERLGCLDINIDKQYEIYGHTYAAAAHALLKS